MNPKPEPAGLRFRHSGLAAVLLLGIAVLVGGLGWWNTRRREAELSALRGKVRILQKMPEGWREWRRWREHADFVLVTVRPRS